MFATISTRSFCLPSQVTSFSRMFLCVIAGILAELFARGQSPDGNNALNQANTLIRGYFDTATLVMYAIGALCGLVSAVGVFMKLIHQDQHAPRHIGVWFLACLFLVLSATLIKTFFGL